MNDNIERLKTRIDNLKTDIAKDRTLERFGDILKDYDLILKAGEFNEVSKSVRDQIGTDFYDIAEQVRVHVTVNTTVESRWNSEYWIPSSLGC